MIGAAADQMAELLDLLSAAARIEGDRLDLHRRPTNAREVADAAVERMPEGVASVAGDGAMVDVDPTWAAVSLGAIAEAARRHGGLKQIELAVDGATVEVSPIVDGAGEIATGENLRDFSAAVGTRVLHAAGATVELERERLRVRFPAP
jgi:signal transduction histidine kinase